MPDEDKSLDAAVEADCQYWEEEPAEPEEIPEPEDSEVEELISRRARHAKKPSSIKGDLRKHGLSTGILVLWLMAVAVLCLVIGGIAGATWQHGTDERAFEVERSAYNDKIATLQSKAEEDQKELAELREFRSELVDLLTEYMIIDVQKQSGNAEVVQNTLEAPGAGGGPEPSANENASSSSSPNPLEKLLGLNGSSSSSAAEKAE